MKRMIRYHNPYANEGPSFSTCSTKYEVLPVLVKDDAGPKQLVAQAKKLGISVKASDVLEPGTHMVPQFNFTHTMDSKGAVTETGRPAVEWRPQHGPIRITHAVKVGETTVHSYNGEMTVDEYLGFVTLMRSDNLKPVREPGRDLTVKQASDVAGYGEFGIQQVADTVDGKVIVIMEGWVFYSGLRLHGYSHEQFKEVLGVTEEGFHDDTFTCGSCGKADSMDDGYTYNYRIVDGEMLGMSCGCYEESCKSPDGLDDFVDDARKGLELDLARYWSEEGRIKFVSRYMGGMTDPGRGGYWHGPDEREGGEGSYGYCDPANPDEVIPKWKAQNPGKSFVLSHDESGQFQTYWSLWEVVDA